MAKAKKLPSGSWRVNLYDYTDPATGKRIYKSFTAATKKEAEYMAAEYKLVGKQRTASAGDMTLKEAYTRYIDSKTNVLSPSTIREYRRSARNDLQDIMPLKLRDITQEAVQRSINQFAANHAPKTVRNAHGLLSAVLGVYYPSFQLSTGLPQKQKTRITIPTEAEVKALLEAAEGTNMHQAILLAAVGTLRRSEICALTQSDVHDNGVMVNKAMVCDDNHEYVIKSTKTTAGTRFVELPKFIIDELRSIDNERVCPYSPITISNLFRTLSMRVLGKPYRFHDLRHHSASVLHAMGVPDLYIMQRGGWENREVLDKIYEHVLSDEQKDFNAKIVDRFTKSYG